MQDIKFVQDNYSNFDLVIENKDLAKVDGFETALNYLKNNPVKWSLPEKYHHASNRKNDPL